MAFLGSACARILNTRHFYGGKFFLRIWRKWLQVDRIIVILTKIQASSHNRGHDLVAYQSKVGQMAFLGSACARILNTRHFYGGKFFLRIWRKWLQVDRIVVILTKIQA